MTAIPVVATTISPNLQVVPGSAVVLPPHLVAIAHEAAKVTAARKALAKQEEGFKTQFENLFASLGGSEFTDSAGKVVARKTHGVKNLFDRKGLKAAQPKVEATFSYNQEWNGIAFP